MFTRLETVTFLEVSFQAEILTSGVEWTGSLATCGCVQARPSRHPEAELVCLSLPEMEGSQDSKRKRIHFFVIVIHKQKLDDWNLDGKSEVKSYWEEWVWIQRCLEVNSVSRSVCTIRILTEGTKLSIFRLNCLPQVDSSQLNYWCKKSRWFLTF